MENSRHSIRWNCGIFTEVVLTLTSEKILRFLIPLQKPILFKTFSLTVFWKVNIGVCRLALLPFCNLRIWFFEESYSFCVRKMTMIYRVECNKDVWSFLDGLVEKRLPSVWESGNHPIPPLYPVESYKWLETCCLYSSGYSARCRHYIESSLHGLVGVCVLWLSEIASRYAASISEAAHHIVYYRQICPWDIYWDSYSWDIKQPRNKTSLSVGSVRSTKEPVWQCTVHFTGQSDDIDLILVVWNWSNAACFVLRYVALYFWYCFAYGLWCAGWASEFVMFFVTARHLFKYFF